MSDTLAIGEHEAGLYRIFKIDLPDVQIDAFTTPVPKEAGGFNYPLRDALGVSFLDSQHVQILDLKELKSVGFETYLSEGLGVAAAEYAPVLPALEAMGGYVAVIATAAFKVPDIIVPKAPVSLIAVVREDKPRQAFVDLSSTSAEGTIAPPPAPLPQRRTGVPVWIILLVVAAALLALYSLITFISAGDPS